MSIIPTLAEFIGTFIFISIILNTTNLGNLQPIAIGIGLMATLFFVMSISGGHLNPAITFMKLFGEKSIELNKAIFHIIAQLSGAILAWYVYKKFHSTK